MVPQLMGAITGKTRGKKVEARAKSTADANDGVSAVYGSRKIDP